MAKQYEEMTLQDFADYASKSSGELGSLGDGWLINYETGEQSRIAGDDDTAVFLASAREMVLELVKRLQQKESIDNMLDKPLSTSKIPITDKSFTAHDDAVSDGCVMCGNEWKSLNKHGYCSRCWQIATE